MSVGSRVRAPAAAAASAERAARRRRRAQEERDAWLVLAPLLCGEPGVALARLGELPRVASTLVPFLTRHGLAVRAWRRLEELRLWPRFPAALERALREERRRQRVLAVQGLAALTELGRLLAARGIAHLFLKGPLLSQQLYGEIYERSAGDVDVLVRPESLGAAEEALCAAGYEPRFGTLGGRRLSRFFSHHFSYQRGRHTVELHWCVAREYGVRIDMEAVWSGSELMRLRGDEHRAPGLETSLVLLVVTVVKDLELGRLRLRSVVDLERIVARLGAAGPWADRLAALERQGLGRIGTASLELALGLTETHELHGPLARSLATRALGALDRCSPTLGLDVFGLFPPAFANKRRLFPLHGTGPSAWLWWLVSLPWRRRVYAP